MTRVLSFPFRRIPPHTVTAEAWRIITDTGEKILASPDDSRFLQDWSYDTSLTLKRKIRIDDCRALLDALPFLGGTDLGDALLLRIRVGTTGSQTGRLPRKTQDHVVRGVFEANELIFDWECSIDTSWCAWQLLLESAIVLKPLTEGLFAPQKRFAFLWSDLVKINLEGDRLRFPLSEVRFSEAGTEDALWSLFVDQEVERFWHQPFTGVVRVLLNTQCTNFVDRVAAADPPTLQAMIADVGFQLMLLAAQDDDFAENLDEYEDGSVGAIVMEWCRGTGIDPAALREELLFDIPGRLTRLQHFFSDLEPPE